MAWFKVDDGMYSHPKVVSIPRADRAAALGTWTICGTWSADKLTDGKIPSYMLDELGGSSVGADALVAAGLWRMTKSGYVFVNWNEFQPTRSEVESARKAERDRKASYRSGIRKNPGHSDDGPPVVPLGQIRIPDTPTRPDPTRPKRESGSRIPLDFSINQNMRDWAKAEVPLVDIDRKLAEFIDYWIGVPGAKGVRRDWEATWRNSMRKQQEFALRDRKPAPAVDWMNR